MQSQYTLEKDQPFILRPEGLTKLINTLQNKKLILDGITAYCKDDASRHFDSLCEFVGYENAKRKEIRSLHIHFKSTEGDQRVTILFMLHPNSCQKRFHCRLSHPPVCRVY